MKLKLGKMTNQELADWFGIKLSSFKVAKQDKLKELAAYAEFTEDKGKVIISRIYNDTYSKKGSVLYEEVKGRIDSTWDESGLDSCSRVGWKIFDELYKEDDNLVPATIYNYTIKGRNQLYGAPNAAEGGPLGSCIYIWCKKEQDGSYSFLTREEQKIKEELQMKYFGNANEREEYIDSLIASGQITEEDGWRELKKISKLNKTNYLEFLQELQSALGGCQIIRGTYVSRNQIEKK